MGFSSVNKEFAFGCDHKHRQTQFLKFQHLWQALFLEHIVYPCTHVWQVYDVHHWFYKNNSSIVYPSTCMRIQQCTFQVIVGKITYDRSTHSVD